MSTYEKITEVIIKELENGQVPWRKPWKGGYPANAASKREYRGINALLLSIASMRHGFKSPYWVTFRQAKQLGGHVKAGEKAQMVIFWKWFEIDKDKSGAPLEKTDHVPMLRTYAVFNLDQTEGVKQPVNGEKVKLDPIPAAEEIVKNYPLPPFIETGEPRAYYRPSADTINMPNRDLFESAEEYYSTLFHEMTHSTGHERRLKREGVTDQHFFGDAVYSKEELIAELGSAFLCAEAGIENATVKNSAAYLRGWLSVLRGDKRLLVLAAAAAQKAVDHILDHKVEKTEK